MKLPKLVVVFLTLQFMAVLAQYSCHQCIKTCPKTPETVSCSQASCYTAKLTVTKDGKPHNAIYKSCNIFGGDQGQACKKIVDSLVTTITAFNQGASVKEESCEICSGNNCNHSPKTMIEPSILIGLFLAAINIVLF